MERNRFRPVETSNRYRMRATATNSRVIPALVAGTHHPNGVAQSGKLGCNGKHLVMLLLRRTIGLPLPCITHYDQYKDHIPCKPTTPAFWRAGHKVRFTSVLRIGSCSAYVSTEPAAQDRSPASTKGPRPDIVRCSPVSSVRSVWTERYYIQSDRTKSTRYRRTGRVVRNRHRPALSCEHLRAISHEADQFPVKAKPAAYPPSHPLRDERCRSRTNSADMRPFGFRLWRCSNVVMAWRVTASSFPVRSTSA